MLWPLASYAPTKHRATDIQRIYLMSLMQTRLQSCNPHFNCSTHDATNPKSSVLHRDGQCIPCGFAKFWTFHFECFSRTGLITSTVSLRSKFLSKHPRKSSTCTWRSSVHALVCRIFGEGESHAIQNARRWSVCFAATAKTVETQGGGHFLLKRT